MFAPLGYVSLDEVYEHLHNEAEKWRLRTPNSEDPKPGGIVEGFFAEDKNYKRTQAYTEWLFQCFLNRHESNLFACHSSGNALKLSLTIVKRIRLYEGSFEDTKKGWDSIVTHCHEPFAFIFRRGFVVSISQAERWISTEVLNEVIATLKTIDACPVCWKIPEQAKKINWLDLCGVKEEAVAENIDLSPKSVARRILMEKEKNPSATREDIKEIVAPTISHGQFKLAWTLASHENPLISKPGRKS